MQRCVHEGCVHVGGVCTGGPYTCQWGNTLLSGIFVGCKFRESLESQLFLFLFSCMYLGY